MLSLSNEHTAASTTMLCIGHSHVACVALAAKSKGFPLRAINFWEIPGAIQGESTQLRFSPTIEQELTHHSGVVFSMIGGAAHNVLGMLVHPRRFDFVLPAEPNLPIDHDAEILPAGAVRRLLEALASDYLATMSLLGSHCEDRLFHMEPPPPSADALRMHADIPWSMYDGMRREISPAIFRYKLWRLHSGIISDWCSQNGVTFVPCPPESMDEHGFLREQYYGDGAHANAIYGECVLSQMRQLA